MYMSKNLDRGFKDLSIFEIGPVFTGSNPGEQKTVVCGLSAGKKSRLSWIDKERNIDLFDAKMDVCLLYTSPSPRDRQKSRMPSSA